jgi:TonB-linked SusC/RagA family outer membrane protein
LSLVLLMGLLMSLYAYPQSAARVQGTVTDEKGTTLPGVSIAIKGTTTGTLTDAGGHYNISVSAGQTLVFSMVGYNTVEVAVNNQTTINAKLMPATSALNEVVVVGYGQQKRLSLTSAVSSVSASDIVTTKNENLLNTLAGKVPGLRIVQNTAEPGAFANNYDIRGMGSPLIVIDGIPRTDIARVDPNDVESISVLKDASAAVYGVRAANGVILVTTKKGKAGTIELNYTGNFGYQVPVNFSKSTNAVEYMILANEQAVHNRANATRGARLYTDANIADYQNGTKQSTDWNDAVIKRSAAQTQHNLSASGGSDKSQYYVSLGYTGQDGILRTGDQTYRKYNLRSNLSSKIAKNLTFGLNLSGTMDVTNAPYQPTWWIIRSTWYQLPTLPLYANNTPPYYNAVPNPPLQALAQSSIETSGYRNFNNKWFQSAANLTYDVPFVKGLSLKGVYSFDYILNNNKTFQKAYNEYNYDAATGNYLVGNVQQSPSTIRREMFEYPTRLAQFWLTYNHSFNNVHNVSASLIYEESTRSGDNFYAQRELAIPIDQLFAGNSTNQQGSQSSSQSNAFTYKNAAYVGNFTYDYKSRYFAKFGFRYDGSSRFATARQWGFFPAAEAGWRISEEPFFKSIKALAFITSLKFRGSYGVLGDDSASSYQFLTGYTYPASGSATGQPAGSVFDGTFINGVQNKGIANPAISWYTSKTFDAGVDLEAWDGKLSITFDYFRRNRTGLLGTQSGSLADVVGASLPQQNLNSDRNEGFDFELGTRNRIGKVNYNVRGTFGFTRIMNVVSTAARLGNSYLNWSQKNGSNIATGANRYTNVYMGYTSTGQFQNYSAIQNSPYFVPRNTVVGDYAYEDWNGDGQINGDDIHPIGNFGLPLITFGFNLGAAYKGFDINALFQGAAMVNASYVEQAQQPLWAGGNALTQFLDRWHPTDPNADPYSPSTQWTPGYYSYTGTYPITNSTGNTHSAAYVRMKSLEVGYSLSNKLLGRSGIRGVRIFFNGYNLLTFTSLKYMDPEHPSGTSQFNASSQQYDYAYPLDKVYSLGVNVKF